MAIDTIKKQKVNSKLLLFVSLMFYAAFGYPQDCKIHPIDFEIVAEDYPQFVEDLNSFYTSDHKYDVVLMKIEGGNYSKSYLIRYYFEENWIKYKNLGGKKVSHEILTVDTNVVNYIFTQIEKSSAIEICPFDSSNDTFVYMLKKKGEIKLKYKSSYSVFSEKNGIDGFRTLVDKVRDL